MKKLLTIAFLLTYNFCFAQTGVKRSCKVEFYLLKKEVPNTDSTKDIRKQFSVTLTDLQDTAFIKDSEIISYSISTDTTRSTIDILKVTNSVVQRVNAVGLPLCCGRQFALVVNGKICYAGYFWNFISSFGCDWVTAFAHDNHLLVWRKLPDYDFKAGAEDLRRNKLLFDCLKATGRLIRIVPK